MKKRLNRFLKIIFIPCSMLVCAFIVSCGGNEQGESSSHIEVDSSAAEIIKIDPSEVSNTDYVYQASLLVDTIEYIPIENSSRVVIGTIDRLITHDQHIYIWDRTSQTVFVFTDTGKYVGKVDKQGKGPEEYIEGDGFSVDRNTGNILIKSTRNWKIFIYSPRGEFIESVPADYLASSFFPLSNGEMLVYNWKFDNKNLFGDVESEHRLFTVDRNSDLVSSDLPYNYYEEYVEYTSGADGFYSFGDSVSLVEVIGSTVYRVDTMGHAYPRFRFDFGAYNGKMSFDLDREALSSVIKEYWDSGQKERARVGGVFEVDNAIGFSYSYQGIYSTAYYSKETGKLVNIGPFWVNDQDNIAMPPHIASTTSDDKSFIGYIEAPVFINMVKNNKGTTSSRVQNIAAELEEIDNPVLVRYTLKDF